MEYVDKDYADQLHLLPFNPYSQFCYMDKTSGSIIWQINALTDEATKQLIKPILQVETVTIRSLQTTLKIKAMSLKTIRHKELTDIIHNNAQTKTVIHFITPTAFKSSGSYVFIPSERLIFQNLLMHYSQTYENSKEVDQETIGYIDKHVRITAYNLRSLYFAHIAGSGKKIPAFIGTMSLSVDGPQTLIGLIQMLLRFGEFAGIGIKTSMGMGGAQCLQISQEPR